MRIDTEHVREVGHRLIAESNHLAEIGHRLRRAIYSLDTWAWDGRSRWRAEPLLSQVRPRCAHLADELYELGRRLVYAADRFEEAEQDALAGIGEHISWEETSRLLIQEKE